MCDPRNSARNVAITLNCNIYIKCYSLLNLLDCLTETNQTKQNQNINFFLMQTANKRHNPPSSTAKIVHETHCFFFVMWLGFDVQCTTSIVSITWNWLVQLITMIDRILTIRNRSRTPHNMTAMAMFWFSDNFDSIAKKARMKKKHSKKRARKLNWLFLMITQNDGDGEWRARACAIVYNQSLTERYGAAGKLTKVCATTTDRIRWERCGVTGVRRECFVRSLFILRSHSRSFIECGWWRSLRGQQQQVHTSSSIT